MIKYFEDYSIGETLKTKKRKITKKDVERFLGLITRNWDNGKRKITQKDINEFADITHDRNELHLDEIVAKESIFKGVVAHGLLTFCCAEGISHKTVYNYSNVNFIKPVRPGDEIYIKKRAKTGRSDYNETILVNKGDKKILEYNRILFPYIDRGIIVPEILVFSCAMGLFERDEILFGFNNVTFEYLHLPKPGKKIFLERMVTDRVDFNEKYGKLTTLNKVYKAGLKNRLILHYTEQDLVEKGGIS